MALWSLVGLWLPVSAWATIAIEQESTYAGDSDRFAYLHKITGNDRLLVVSVHIEDGSTPVSSVTYAGLACQREVAATHSLGSLRLEVWSLVNPPAGEDSVIVLLSGSNVKTAIASVTYSGVDQTDPTDGATLSQGTNSDVLVVVASEVGDLVQDAMISLASGLPAVGDGQVQRWAEELGGAGVSAHFGAGSTELGDAAVSMSWKLPQSQRWIAAGLNINHAAAASPSPEGVAVWRDGATPVPEFAVWSSGAFGLVGSTVNVGDYRTMAAAESQSRDELIVVGVNDSRQVVGMMRFGSTWTTLSGNPLATLSEDVWWSTDLAYEPQSGDAVVVYANGTTGGSPLSRIVWNGATWSAAAPIAVPLAGEAKQIQVAAHPRQDEMVLVASNSSSRDYALVWNGSAWGNALVLDASGAGDDRTDIQAIYSHQTGTAMVTYARSSNDVYFRTWNGTAWSGEGAVSRPGSVSDPVRWTLLAADPNSDRIVLGVVTHNDEVWLNVWDGSAWAASILATSSSDGDWYPAVAVAFEATSGEALATYNESSSFVRFRTWTAGAGWSSEQIGPSLGSTPHSMTLSASPFSDRIMLSAVDVSFDFNSVLWDGGAWGTPTELEANTSEDRYQPFVFTWLVDEADLAVQKSVDASAPRPGDTIRYTVTVSNAGPALASAITVFDTLPAGLTYLVSVPTQGAYDTSSGLWDVGQLAAGDTAWLVLMARVDTGTEGTTLLNVAQVFNKAQPDSDPSNDTAKVSARVNTAPVLSSIGPQFVAEGDTLNLRVTATDADLDSLVLWAEGLPANATFFDSGNGSAAFSFAPDFSQIGNHTVRFVASDGAHADTEAVSITVVMGPLAYVRIEYQDGTPVAAVTLTTDVDTTLVFCRGYTASGGLRGSVTGNWLWAGPDSIGYFASGADSVKLVTLTTPGQARMAVFDSSGFTDTTGVINCDAGVPATLHVAPNAGSFTTDTLVQFSGWSLDADGNLSDPQALISWTVAGGIGSINSSGLFDPTTVGSGQIIATSGALADTTSVFTVLPGRLNSLRIQPDTATVALGDSVSFTAFGLDADSNTTATGPLSWRLLGAIGRIDSTGLFVADRPGSGRVSVTGDFGVADTSQIIHVDELYVSVLSLGSWAVAPRSDWQALLTVRIDNYYATARTITGLSVRDRSRGPGTLAQRLANVDSVALYLDSNPDSLLGSGDTRLAASPYSAASTAFALAPLTVAAGEAVTLIAAVKTARFARDGDTLDLCLATASDLVTSDGTVASGPDTANSFGHVVVDGLVAAQLDLSALGNVDAAPADSLYRALTFRLPGNGYQSDTLKSLSLVNFGSATASDFDSLALFADDGDGVWEGAGVEAYAGRLVHTGSHWTRSGLASVLPPGQTTFHVAAAVADYPINGATLVLGVPQGGVVVASGNDGPWDGGVASSDTLFVVAEEQLSVSSVPMPARTLVPGASSGPIWGVRLANGYVSALSIDSLSLNLLATSGGATQAQLDSQIDSVLLYWDRDGDPQAHSPQDSLVASAQPTNGKFVLATAGLTVPAAGGQVTLVARVALNGVSARDGNTLNLSFALPGGLYTTPVATVVGNSPVSNPAAHTIDLFPGSLVALTPVSTQTVFGGQTHKPVLAFRLPGNGYAPDTLVSLSLANAAELDNEGSIATLKLWRDATGNGFSADDPLLGTLVYTLPLWQLPNLRIPVLPGGLPLVVTVSVADTDFDGGTLRLELPKGGVRYASSMDGPDDLAVMSTQTHLVLPANNITVVPVPAASAPIFPGSRDNLVLTFALYNGYISQTQTLTSLRFSNATLSQSAPSYVDLEMGRVSLYLDADKNRLLSADSLVATGFFVSGSLLLSGLNVQLPAESLSYFFVALDAPQEMVDSDSLAVIIAAPSDLAFAAPVKMNGSLPLTSGGYLVVNGSVASQYELLSLPPRTLSPGDSDVTLLAFRPAANGDQPDVLTGVTFDNLGDAVSTDFARVSLWADANLDYVWQATDTWLGDFSYSAGAWSLGSLSLPVGISPPVLFVSATVDSLAAPGALFQGLLPLLACQYQSANDGPVDSVLVADFSYAISNSGLRLLQSPLATTYSIGQSIELRATLTNVTVSSMPDVSGSLLSISDTSAVTLDSSQVGPYALGPGAAADVVWHFTARQPGNVYFDLRGVAPTVPDSSAALRTPTFAVQARPSDVTVTLVNSMPAAVTRGQANVFPFSLRYAHPDPGPATAAVRLDSLQVHVADGLGNPVPADAVLNRMVLYSGSQPVSTQSFPPASADVWMRFVAPQLLNPGQSARFALLIDIDSATTASDLVLSLSSASAIPLLDANALTPLNIDPSVSFPLATASCRIDDPSQNMTVAYRSLLPARVNRGQRGVGLLRLYLRHPGPGSGSQIQLSALDLRLRDSVGAPLVLANVADKITLEHASTAVATIQGNQLNTDAIHFALTLPVILGPFQRDSVDICVDVSAAPVAWGFDATIPDSSFFLVRDLSSGAKLSVATDTSLATGTLFPMTTGLAQLQSQASPPEICFVDVLWPAISAGVDSVPLVSLQIDQPGSFPAADARLRAVRVEVVDSSGTLLDPAALFDRIAWSSTSAGYAYQPLWEVLGGGAVFKPSDSGLLLPAGNSVALTLYADIEADVPYDHFALRVFTASSITAHDATDTTRALVADFGASCPQSYPYVTSFAQVFLPAGRPVLATKALGPRLSVPGDTGVTLFSSSLSYASATPLGDVMLRSMRGKVWRRTDAGIVAQPSASLFGAVHLVMDGQRVATDSLLVSDSVNYLLASPYLLSRGETVDLDIVASLLPSAPTGNYFITFADSVTVDMADAQRGTPVYAIVPGGFPLSTADLSVAHSGLSESFVNFPNPFHPNRDGPTTIGFSLSEPAYIDLEVFTITGEAVHLLARGEYRTAGSHQSITWNGTNHRGQAVVPGTYICQIKAQYVSGKHESSRRKIAVIR